MLNDFTFWLRQQPKEVQFLWYVVMIIILAIGLIYGILQEPKEE